MFSCQNKFCLAPPPFVHLYFFRFRTYFRHNKVKMTTSKVCVVTGASYGLGSHIAKQLGECRCQFCLLLPLFVAYYSELILALWTNSNLNIWRSNCLTNDGRLFIELWWMDDFSWDFSFVWFFVNKCLTDDCRLLIELWLTNDISWDLSFVFFFVNIQKTSNWMPIREKTENVHFFTRTIIVIFE